MKIQFQGNSSVNHQESSFYGKRSVYPQISSSVEFKNQSLKYKSLVDCGDMIIPMLMLICFPFFHYKVWFLYCWVLMIMLLILGDSQDGIFICFCEFMISYELETCKFGCSWCIIWWIHLCLRCACKVFDKMPKKLEIMQYS